MFKSKLKASSIHFLLSFIIITLIVGTIVLVWFPSPFLGISRFKEIFTILVAVDLILGPLLTFIVYKTGKKSLRFDLSTIAAIQISALAYGLYTLYLAHPVFITYNVDRFTFISAKEALPENAKTDKFRISKLSAPLIVFAKMPTSIKDKNKLLMEVLAGEPDIDRRAEFYEPYQEHLDHVLSNSLDPKVIFSDEKDKLKLNKFIQKQGGKVSDFAYFPLEGTVKDVVWVLDKKTGQPISTINSDPWKTARKKKTPKIDNVETNKVSNEKS